MAALLHLTASGGALANHCPREFGSQCCGRTDPGPHPRADEGWRWVCEWPDGCHHRCHGVKDEPGTGGSGPPLLMLPQNTVQGSCRAFNERMQSPGITKKSGKTQAGWGGYTAFEVRFDAKWTWSSVSSGQQGGQVKRCIKVTAVVPNFRLEVAELDILQWEPGSEPTGRCKQAYDDWQRRAMAHEQEHVPRAEAIVRDRNAGWKPRAFTPTVCGTGADAAAALDDAKRAAKERVEDHVRRSAEEIAPVIEENGKEMDKSNKVGFMDCSSCP